jgi:uncharacterized protein YndB with AHSA1/START domain
MKSEKGRMFWSTGTYKEVVANKKIVSTMSFSNENGKTISGSQVSVPGQWPNEIIVIVEFSESEGRARVTVTEVGIPLIAYAMSKIGWAQQFDKIQLLLPKKGNASFGGWSVLPCPVFLSSSNAAGLSRWRRGFYAKNL